MRRPKLAGWFARSLGSIALSVLVTALWGGLVFGVLPGHPGISWQAHLDGFIGGEVVGAAHPSTLKQFARIQHELDEVER